MLQCMQLECSNSDQNKEPKNQITMARFPIKSFEPHGYYCINSSLIEVQFNQTNEAVRYRITTFCYATGENTVYYGHWQPVRFDKRGRAYLRDWHNYVKLSPKNHKRLYIDNFMIINNR